MSLLEPDRSRYTAVKRVILSGPSLAIDAGEVTVLTGCVEKQFETLTAHGLLYGEAVGVIVKGALK